MLMNLMLAVGFDTLFAVLVFVIIAGLSSWLKKKQRADEDNGSLSSRPSSASRNPQRRPPPMASSPPRATSWEDELRRLLQGEPEAPATPPPVIVSSAPPPQLHPQPGASLRPPTLPAARTPRRAPIRPTRPLEVALTVSSSGFQEGMKAQEIQEKTKELDRQVQKQMRMLGEHLRHQTAEMEAPKAAAERLLARAMLRDRQSIRAAMVVSAILGPPKALEGQPASRAI